MTLGQMLINKQIDMINAQIAEHNSYIVNCRESIITYESQIEDCNKNIAHLLIDLEKLK